MNTTVWFGKTVHTLLLSHLTFQVRPPSVTVKKHHNLLFELFCCRLGEVDLHIGSKVVTVPSGEWVFLKPGVKHQFRNKSGQSFSFFQLHFDIDDKELRRTLSAVPYLHIGKQHEHGQRLASILTDIEQSLPPDQDKAPAGETLRLPLTRHLACQAYVLLMIGEIAAAAAALQGNAAAGDERTAYTLKIAHRIEEKLNGLVCSPGTITDIARELNLSSSQCTKIFRSVYGTSPRQYVSEQKLNKAKELLVKTDRSIGRIAHELGFSSLHHFSRQFHRWTGMPPNDFRPRHSL